MVGHNWGSEHAERWIWLSGCNFAEAPGAWLDIALGRLLVAGRMTPWVANGTISIDGERHRVGGLVGARPRVRESVEGCSLAIGGGRNRAGIALAVQVPAGTAAGWRYADPDGGEHDVVNCSIAALEVTVTPPGGERRSLRAGHGGVYELGMRERTTAWRSRPSPTADRGPPAASLSGLRACGRYPPRGVQALVQGSCRRRQFPMLSL